MPVNQERVQLLVDALRSGEFPQGRNTLRTPDDKYCCLGVACEVARRNGIGIEWTMRQPACSCDDCAVTRWSFAGSVEALETPVSSWYGFDGGPATAADPLIATVDGVDVRMIQANDRLGWTFDQIADALTERYLNTEDAA